MEGVKFNINDYVMVKLTDRGKHIYLHQYDALNKQMGKEVIKPRYPKVDADGYTAFQMWALMELFGPYTGLVVDMPFETNIIIKM